jgi:nucleotide-binding universal stress UspA family protein
MKTIIVPLDGSALGEQALPYARLYAALLDANVVLLRVVTDEEQQAFLFRRAAELRLEAFPRSDEPPDAHPSVALADSAAAYLEAQAEMLRAAGLHVAVSVYTGSAAECIVEASHHPDTLIIMATHGYSGLRRWTIGSVADKVVHNAAVPVLLVRAGAVPSLPLPLARIMVPLDGSAIATQALPVAVEFATRARADLVLLQAVLPFVDLTPAYAPLSRPLPVPHDLIDEERTAVQQQLQQVVAHLNRPDLRISLVTEVGYPADVILDEAGKRRADLIVMATHGRSGLRRWVLGSVADKVLHASHIPLLLVRAQEG